MLVGHIIRVAQGFEVSRSVEHRATYRATYERHRITVEHAIPSSKRLDIVGYQGKGVVDGFRKVVKSLFAHFLDAFAQSIGSNGSQCLFAMVATVSNILANLHNLAEQGFLAVLSIEGTVPLGLLGNAHGLFHSLLDHFAIGTEFRHNHLADTCAEQLILAKRVAQRKQGSLHVACSFLLGTVIAVQRSDACHVSFGKDFTDTARPFLVLGHVAHSLHAYVFLNEILYGHAALTGLLHDEVRILGLLHDVGQVLTLYLLGHLGYLIRIHAGLVTEQSWHVLEEVALLCKLEIDLAGHSGKVLERPCIFLRMVRGGHVELFQEAIHVVQPFHIGTRNEFSDARHQLHGLQAGRNA